MFCLDISLSARLSEDMNSFTLYREDINRDRFKKALTWNEAAGCMWVGAVAAGGGRFLLFFLFGVNVPLFSLSLNQKLDSAKGIEPQTGTSLLDIMV